MLSEIYQNKIAKCYSTDNVEPPPDPDFLAFAARPAVSRAEKLKDALVPSVEAGALVPFLFNKSVKSTLETNIQQK